MRRTLTACLQEPPERLERNHQAASLAHETHTEFPALARVDDDLSPDGCHNR